MLVDQPKLLPPRSLLVLRKSYRIVREMPAAPLAIPGSRLQEFVKNCSALVAPTCHPDPFGC